MIDPKSPGSVETFYEVDFSDDGVRWTTYRFNQSLRTAQANALRVSNHHKLARVIEHTKAPYAAITNRVLETIGN
jgi:hypothetical protein